MRARSRREHHYQIPVKDAIWASSVERRTVRRSTSDEEPKVGDGSTRRRMDGQFWKAVKWVGKSEFLGYGRESGSRSPMRKEAEAKLIISFQSQQEKTAMLYLLRPTRKDRYLLTMKIKWAQSSNLPFKTDLKSYINFGNELVLRGTNSPGQYSQTHIIKFPTQPNSPLQLLHKSQKLLQLFGNQTSSSVLARIIQKSSQVENATSCLSFPISE